MEIEALIDQGLDHVHEAGVLPYPFAFPVSERELLKLITATAAAMTTYAGAGHPDHDAVVRLNRRLNAFWLEHCCQP